MVNHIKLNKVTLHEFDKVFNKYFDEKHPQDSNGLIIILSEQLQNNYEERKSYIIKFPFIKNDNDKLEIINKWSEYAIENIIKNYDLLTEFTIVSINSIDIENDIKEISINYLGSNINPESFIKLLTIDIIEQLNKHLIETYMDLTYPEIDMDDSEQMSSFNEEFNNIDLKDIYNKYSTAEVYIPINYSNNNENNIVFYLNGIIKTNSTFIDIVNDIRSNLDTDDLSEIFNYDKENIVYKFSNNQKLSNFSIISDPII